MLFYLLNWGCKDTIFFGKKMFVDIKKNVIFYFLDF